MQTNVNKSNTISIKYTFIGNINEFTKSIISFLSSISKSKKDSIILFSI